MNLALVQPLLEAGIFVGSKFRYGENRVRCPQCDRDKRDDALAVLVEADSACWLCHRCGWRGSVHADKRYNAKSFVPRVQKQPAKRAAPMSMHNEAARIWRDSQPLAGTLGEQYLLARRCELPPADGDVRFHPTLLCKELERDLPAIVCRVSTVVGDIGVGVHRIYLNPDGGTRALAKRRLGGSDEPVCIRLWPEDSVVAHLAIGEGVETMLAAARCLKPAWSCIDAGQLARFPVLRGIESLTIFADHDTVGLKAARAAQARYFAANITAQALRSPRVGEDFNDVVMREATC
jgi:putative DNA primase/helicase